MPYLSNTPTFSFIRPRPEPVLTIVDPIGGGGADRVAAFFRALGKTPLFVLVSTIDPRDLDPAPHGLTAFAAALTKADALVLDDIESAAPSQRNAIEHFLQSHCADVPVIVRKTSHDS